MTCLSSTYARLRASLLCVLALGSTILSFQANASTSFDHDANGNLTAVRPAVPGPPVILSEPSDQPVRSGGGGGFSVVISTSSPATFQWKRENGTNVAGATGDSLYFADVTPAVEGRYYVVVTNAGGSVTSASAFIYMDTNGNTLPDTWEMTYFGNLTQTAAGDFDGDGVSNLDEYNQGLNPAVREIVYWIAASGDFTNAANWSRGRLPIEGDTAVINSGTFTLPTSGTIRASQVTVNVPYTAPASDMTLRIKGKWNFNSNFTLTSGRRFTVDGDATGAEVTVSGSTALNGAGLTVSGGAKVTFASVLNFVHPANFDVDWEAREANSELVFPSLTTITGPSTSGEYLTIEAYSAGTVSCPLLTSITKPQDDNTNSDSGVWLYAGSSGLVSAPVLAAFNDHDSHPYSLIQANDEGTLHAPQLLTVKGAKIDLNEESNPQRFTSLTNAREIIFNSGSGAATTSNLASISGTTTLRITGGFNVTFGSLNSVNNLTRIQVDSGSKARFNGVTSYVHPASLNLDVTWESRDANSELVLPNLASITGPTTAGEILSIEAYSAGTISCPLLTSITKSQDDNTNSDSGVWLYAGNSGLLSAPVLAAFNDHDSHPYSLIQANGGGILQAPQLLTVKGAKIDLNEESNPQRFTSLTNAREIIFNSGSGAATTSNLASISGTTTLRITGGFNLTFGSLNSINNLTEIQVDSGSKARFSGVTNYVHPASLNLDVTWEARDANSELIFTSLTSITGPSTPGEYLYINAYSGGIISFPLLTTVTKPTDGNTSFDSGVELNAWSGAISAPVLSSFRDNDTRPDSLITRGTTGVLALPSLIASGTLGVALSGTALPATASPLINTPTATNLTASGATLGGNVSGDGGNSVTERGVVFSVSTTNSNPVIGGSGVTKVTATGTTGSFTAAVTGLTQATRYSYKAYATNGLGTSYTNVATFTTLSSNANLSWLYLSHGSLNPSFASGTTSYTANVANAVSSITITPSTSQANATIAARINGGTFASVSNGNASGALALNMGANTVEVRVTAQDGVTQKTYTVTVNRLIPPTVTAPTATNITATGATLGGNVTSDGGSTITERGIVIATTATNVDPVINGTGVTEIPTTGTTGIFTLAVIQMTPETGYSYKAYAINGGGVSYSPVADFTTPSNNADLSNLALSSGSLSPVFASGTTTYTTAVANTASSINVTATAAHANAAIQARVNGGTYDSVTSGNASGALPLNVGSNTVEVRVTAHDGLTQKSYSVTVTRLAVPTVANPTVTNLTTTEATLGGNVTNDGGSTISERGVVYAATATNNNPVIGGPGVTKMTANGTMDVFTVGVTGLTPARGYTYKAFATNSEGTSYTSAATFTTRNPPATQTLQVPFFNGIGTVAAHRIEPGDTHRFTFSLAFPSDAAFTTTGLDAATWELRDGGGALVASGTGNVGFGGLLLSGNHVLSLNSTGSTTQTFSLDLDASLKAIPKPDLSIGADPTAATGVGVYPPTAQAIAISSKRAVPKTVFAKVGNEGLLPDSMTLRGSAGNRLFAVGYSSGGGNVTAQMIGGTFTTGVLGPDDAAVGITVTVTPNKRLLKEKVKKGKRLRTTYLRKNYSGLIEAKAAGDANLSDTVIFQVKTTR